MKTRVENDSNKDGKSKTSTWKKTSKEERKVAKEEKLLKEHFKKKVQDSTPVEVEKEKLKRPTLSIALPGSILENAQSRELRTYLAGQIARAAAIYKVDEVVVFDELCQIKQSVVKSVNEGVFDQGGDRPNCNVHLVRVLQYLECPQYLRKAIFPIHKDFQFAGVLNPLDCPHHFRSEEMDCPFREAVILNKPVKEGKGSLCDAGIFKDVQIDRHLIAGVRVTVNLDQETLEAKRPQGTIVSAAKATAQTGLYWGYNVRLAKSISAVVSECPYEGGYDCTIGTSDKADALADTFVPPAKHYLLVLGGLKGLESCLESDEMATANSPREMFDVYVNTCPAQGSRTIRTEEALVISLAMLDAKTKRE